MEGMDSALEKVGGEGMKEKGWYREVVCVG